MLTAGFQPLASGWKHMFQSVQVVPQLHQCLGTLDFLTPMQNVAVSSLMRCRGRGQPCANIYCRPWPCSIHFQTVFLCMRKDQLSACQVVHTALLVPSAEIAEMPAFVFSWEPYAISSSKSNRAQRCTKHQKPKLLIYWTYCPIVLLCFNSESWSQAASFLIRNHLKWNQNASTQ